MTQARGQTHLCGVWLTATFVVGEGSVMWWLCRVFGLGFLAVYEIERRWCKGGHPRSVLLRGVNPRVDGRRPAVALRLTLCSRYQLRLVSKVCSQMRNKISAPMSVGCIAPNMIRVRFMRLGNLVTSSRLTKPFRAYIFGAVSSIEIESVRITLPIRPACENVFLFPLTNALFGSSDSILPR